MKQPQQLRNLATILRRSGDQIAGLTLKQAKDLSDYLKEEHGIEAAAGGGASNDGCTRWWWRW